MKIKQQYESCLSERGNNAKHLDQCNLTAFVEQMKEEQKAAEVGPGSSFHDAGCRATHRGRTETSANKTELPQTTLYTEGQPPRGLFQPAKGNAPARARHSVLTPELSSFYPSGAPTERTGTKFGSKFKQQQQQPGRRSELASLPTSPVQESTVQGQEELGLQSFYQQLRPGPCAGSHVELLPRFAHAQDKLKALRCGGGERACVRLASEQGPEQGQTVRSQAGASEIKRKIQDIDQLWSKLHNSKMIE